MNPTWSQSIKKFFYSQTSEENATKSDYIPPQQSANTLFHFIKDVEWLNEILSDKIISARYGEEKFNFLSDELPSLIFPMKCFCDIYLEKLSTHMSTYGQYGIGFDKKWLIEQGVQPIQYINSKSEIGKELRQKFLSYCERYGNNIPKKIYHNSFFRRLRYIKPIAGEMTRDGKTNRYNFHDEKEWRYVPNVSLKEENVDLIWDEIHDTQAKRAEQSRTLSNLHKYCIPFEYDAIRYIIVPTDEERNDMIDFIEKKIDIQEKHEKMVLISKILVFDKNREDW